MAGEYEAGGIIGTLTLDTDQIDAAAKQAVIATAKIEKEINGLIAQLKAGDIGAERFAESLIELRDRQKELAAGTERTAAEIGRLASVVAKADVSSEDAAKREESRLKRIADANNEAAEAARKRLAISDRKADKDAVKAVKDYYAEKLAAESKRAAEAQARLSQESADLNMMLEIEEHEALQAAIAIESLAIQTRKETEALNQLLAASERANKEDSAQKWAAKVAASNKAAEAFEKEAAEIDNLAAATRRMNSEQHAKANSQHRQGFAAEQDRLEHLDAIAALGQGNTVHRMKDGGIGIDLTEAREDLAKYEAQIFAMSARIDQLKGKSGFSGVTASDAAEIKHLSDAKKQLTTASDRLSESIARETALNRAGLNSSVLMASAHEQATGKAAKLGNGLMQLGYVVDDIQYGFGAVVNNIQPLVSGFGATALAAGGIGIAAVATYQLTTRWHELKEAMGAADVLTHSQEMEKLAKATSLTADETERLNKHKQMQADIQEVVNAKTEKQKESEKAVKDVVLDADGDKLIRATEAGLKAAGQATPLTDAEKKAALQEARGKHGMIGWLANHSGSEGDASGFAGQMIDPLSEDGKKGVLAQAQAAKDRQKAQELLAGAANDPGKKAQLMAMAADNPQAFPAGFARKLDGKDGQRKVDQERREKEAEDALKIEKEAPEQEREWRKKIGQAELDAEQKRLAKIDKDEKGERQRKKEWRADNREVADMVMPGLDQKADMAVMQGKLAGIPMEEVGNAIADALEKAGMSKEDAKVAAKDQLNESVERVDSEVARKEMKMKEGEKESKSEVYGASDLTSKIQSSISNMDESRKQTGIQEKMLENLAVLAKSTDQNIIRLAVN